MQIDISNWLFIVDCSRNVNNVCLLVRCKAGNCLKFVSQINQKHLFCPKDLTQTFLEL